MEWAALKGMCRDKAAEDHIKYFFKCCEEKKFYKLYQFNVSMKRYEWLDGTVRPYVHKTKR